MEVFLRFLCYTDFYGKEILRNEKKWERKQGKEGNNASNEEREAHSDGSVPPISVLDRYLREKNISKMKKKKKRKWER